MLRIEDLRVLYGDFPAVVSASLEVRVGETVALIGVNGSGKSTLLNTAAGLLYPATGSVLFNGEDITALPAEQIVERGLVLVPQGGRCFLRMSVEDNLLTGSYCRRARAHIRQAKERVFELLPVLREKRNAPAGTLSGGQRQMLAIGRALMSEPKCLMFDELSLGLAPIAVAELYAALNRLRSEEKLTVLLVEQNTDRALRMSDRYYVMRKGETVLAAAAAAADSEALRAAVFGVGNSRETG